jgi:peptide/nickel transport system permease protein
MPYTYVENLARQHSQMPGAKSYQTWLDQLNNIYGLDKDIISGFFGWITQIFTGGGFGDSWKYTIPVVEKFKNVIWYSIFVNCVTLVFELCASIPLGILAARKQYSKTDYSVTVFALIGISLPSFFFATLLKYVFAVKLGWFDISGAVGRYFERLDIWGQLLDRAHHLVLPVIVLMMMSIGGLMRFTRTNMLEVLNMDYIRTARAKGLPERKVMRRHAFRNTLIPLVSYMSYLLPAMFSGSLIVEQIFQIPGIGHTAYEAIIVGDIPFTMFYMTFLIVLTQVSLIIADILYAVVDPRVRMN